MRNERWWCDNCDKEVEEVIEVDHGGYEEVWGARVWHSQMTDCCNSCGKDDIELLLNSDDVELTVELANLLRP